MRMGKLKFEISEIVDLDNPKMVKIATNILLDNIYNVYKKWDFDLEEVEDNTLTESDISSWLQECIEDGLYEEN